MDGTWMDADLRKSDVPGFRKSDASGLRWKGSRVARNLQRWSMMPEVQKQGFVSRNKGNGCIEKLLFAQGRSKQYSGHASLQKV